MVLHQHLVVEVYWVVQIVLFIYGMLRQDNKKPNQMVIQIGLCQFVTLLMVLHQHLVVKISLSDYGILKQDNIKLNWMAIQQQYILSISLLMEIHQLLVVKITLSDFGMQKHQRKYSNQMVAIKICLPSLTYLFRIAPYCQMVFIINYYLVNPDRTILRICQNPWLEASGTLILQGQFMNYQGIDLKPLFKSIGSCFLEDLKQKQK
ncbi:unnamed protein product [Paramecium octaurelia]|uniref:Transmembrane protein n=1 Tax=Paramecium octaurelia TaxID=43137 RepID=A0A8S1Y584_PAROT|nr:unnamed protein product [Paramecium octaurelia]